MLEVNRLYNEDCLQCMKRIDDKAIDCIITDLPYGVLNKGNKGSKWDSLIPFESIWNQYNRIIKDNGAIILFAQGMFTANLMKSNEKIWRYNLIWKKGERTSGFLNANRQPLRNHEDICMFYKKQPTYNPQFETGFKPSHKCGKISGEFSVGAETNNCYGNYSVIENREYGDRRFPKSILNFDREHPPIHNTQKPVLLYEWMIKTYTNPGDLILDSCAGSMTLSIAAINTGRKFICMEKDKEIFDIGRKRVEEYLKSRETQNTNESKNG